MSTASRAAIGYAGVAILAFVWLYVVTGVREMGLHLAMMALNLPSSVVLVPTVESLSLASGLTLGAAPHVILTELLCVTVNSLVVWAVTRALGRRG